MLHHYDVYKKVIYLYTKIAYWVSDFLKHTLILVLVV